MQMQWPKKALYHIVHIRGTKDFLGHPSNNFAVEEKWRKNYWAGDYKSFKPVDPISFFPPTSPLLTPIYFDLLDTF